ncbi:MAG: hypothetical protein VYE40_11100 [Myxococcota bacterium]|nr:hypothetical protein [Myxococcota bacterium]MEC9441640.1 hypothetical protein [Myxococcota bacterium]
MPVTTSPSPLKTLAMVLLSSAALSACGGQQKAAGPPPDFKFEIDVRVSLDSQKDKGVAGMPVLLDGKTIGYTDREGKFRALLTDKPKTEVTLAIGKNPAYKFVPNETYETTQALSLKYNKERTGVIAEPVQLFTSVASAEVEYLVWVSADCDKDLEPVKCVGIPVKMGDKVVGTTDAQGRAHFVHVGTPNQTLALTLDTTTPDIEGNSRNIEPASPTYEVELGKEAQVYNISETFTEIEEEDTKKKTKRSTRRKSTRRVAKSSSKKSPSKKSTGGKSTKKSSSKKVSSKKSTPKKETKKSSGSKEDPISLF